MVKSTADAFDAIIEAHAAQNRRFMAMSARVTQPAEEMAEEEAVEKNAGSCDGDDTLVFILPFHACWFLDIEENLLHRRNIVFWCVFSIFFIMHLYHHPYHSLVFALLE